MVEHTDEWWAAARVTVGRRIMRVVADLGEPLSPEQIAYFRWVLEEDDRLHRASLARLEQNVPTVTISEHAGR